jgi:hypothetical protein
VAFADKKTIDPDWRGFILPPPAMEMAFALLRGVFSLPLTADGRETMGPAMRKYFDFSSFSSSS